jgi:arylsulfatase A-like enzyme
MRQRKYITIFLILIWLSGILAGCQVVKTGKPALDTQGPCFEVPSQPTTQRPNIVFILTDDMDAELMAEMPNLQRLVVQQGVSLDRFFVNVPQCCPSRSTILLGQYSQNSGIYRNGGEQGGFKTFFKKGLEAETIAVGLNQVGYRTVLMGKYLNGYPGDAKKRTYIPPGWDEWYVPSSGTPYANLQYKLNENGEIVNYHREQEDYLTDVLAAKAEDFIRRSATEEQPFFVYLSTYAPHGPASPAIRHTNLFLDRQAPRPPSFNEEDVSDKPSHIRNQPPLSDGLIRGIDNFYVARLQMLQSVDEMIARLVETLADTGTLDNTYIIFTSDNGFHLGQHRMEAGKLAPYEEDIRVPFVVRGPGLPAGERRSQITGNVDLAATFAEIGGLEPGKACDGRSLLPLLRGDELAAWRDAYLVSYWAGRVSSAEATAESDGTLEPPDGDLSSSGEEADPNIPAFKALRTDRYLYVEYQTGESELYDMKVDPWQLDNLASSADSNLLKAFSAWLKLLSNCKGAGCLTADREPRRFPGEP